jgi:hypothetical protein
MQMVLADHAVDDDDLLARAAYLVTQSHEEGPDRELANALFTGLGISPRKNRRRGRPRKRTA